MRFYPSQYVKISAGAPLAGPTGTKMLSSVTHAYVIDHDVATHSVSLSLDTGQVVKDATGQVLPAAGPYRVDEKFIQNHHASDPCPAHPHVKAQKIPLSLRRYACQGGGGPNCYPVGFPAHMAAPLACPTCNQALVPSGQGLLMLSWCPVCFGGGQLPLPSFVPLP